MGHWKFAFVQNSDLKHIVAIFKSLSENPEKYIFFSIFCCLVFDIKSKKKIFASLVVNYCSSGVTKYSMPQMIQLPSIVVLHVATP